MSTHTPTPWHIEGREIQDVDDLPVCFVSTDSLYPANAAFIVRACNAHDDLLAALKVAQHWMDYTSEDKNVNCDELKVIEAAIAKAEGDA